MRHSRRLIPVVFCLAGLFTGHGPILLSGFARLQNDLGDSRLNNYLFEHSYRWLLRQPGHLSFWDPAFFFPAKNVEAYSECLLGSAPFYWLWRAVGFAPDTSFQLWVLAVSVLNFAAAYWLLRGPNRLGVLASSAGAFLFAFAASRINQTMHHQLFPHFFTAVAVGALQIALETTDGRTAKRALWTFAGCAALQLYASVYLGWYLGFGLLLAAAWALAVPPWRAKLLALVGSQWRTAAAAAVSMGLFLSWMVLHYVRVTKDIGSGADWNEVLTMLPRGPSWVNVGPYHWLYGATSSWSIFKDLPMEHEQRMGVGAVTTALVLMGLALVPWRKGPGFWAVMLASTVILSSVYIADFSPWRGVFAVVPGAPAIRALCRISLALLVPASIGVARGLEWLKGRAGWWLALPLSAAVVLEQGETTPSYSRDENRADIAKLAAQVDPARCDAFLFSPTQGQLQWWKYQLDAMWTSMETGVPTVNGYSRTNPPGWNLKELSISYEDEETSIHNALASWEKARGLNADRVCWLRPKVRDGPNQADFVSQSVPRSMTAGQGYDVAVTFRNSGDSTWTTGAQYRLGAQAPQDSKTWTTQRAELSHDVPPGQTADFRFHVTAPTQAGRQPFRWRMLKEGIMWFGDYTDMAWVDVQAP
jgi:hypothetical protein